MRPEEAAYVGAMLDGEGSARVYVANGYPYPRMDIYNSEVEIMSALLRATGTGRVYRHGAGANKTIWTWSCFRMRDLDALLPQLLPYSTKAQYLFLEWDGERGVVL